MLEIMPLLLEIFLSLVRIIFLFTGTLISIIFGREIYISINSFLQTYTFPCLEIISFLVIFSPAVGIFIGTHIQKYFWQRHTRYNTLIFITAFCAGVGLTFIPLGTITQDTAYCASPTQTLPMLSHMFGTGLITAIFTMIGMDYGVVLKHGSKFMQTETKNNQKKKRKR